MARDADAEIEELHHVIVVNLVHGVEQERARQRKYQRKQSRVELVFAVPTRKALGIHEQYGLLPRRNFIDILARHFIDLFLSPIRGYVRLVQVQHVFRVLYRRKVRAACETHHAGVGFEAEPIIYQTFAEQATDEPRAEETLAHAHRTCDSHDLYRTVDALQNRYSFKA
eukprot:CAMPEP_0171706928 /NCGR_PEP_ID=MMETSP0991-20121206/14033_1 /TAXON_ID=483369 /ORGANISM="non described non described, Strain CCMP2098" /LENGTH=168 /DNA_ID=CAMNT_0012296655 /DNA_START=151 /DNA_END=657 /DNA_ORIENTATION=-